MSIAARGALGDDRTEKPMRGLEVGTLAGLPTRHGRAALPLQTRVLAGR